jgi:hypothetical protein
MQHFVDRSTERGCIDDDDDDDDDDGLNFFLSL